jgi:hypothetical protein
MENLGRPENKLFVDKESAQVFLLFLKQLLENTFKDEDIIMGLFLTVVGVTNEDEKYVKLSATDLHLICEELQISEDIFNLPLTNNPKDILIYIKEKTSELAQILRQAVTVEKLRKMNNYITQ